MTDLAANLGAQRLAAEQRRHRHRWTYDCAFGNEACNLDGQMHCICGATKDEQKSKRGKSARRRGNDYERSIASKLGAKRVGQYGSKPDVQSEWIVIQAKCGGAFSERYWRWLEELPHDHRLRALFVSDAPGPGHKRREFVVIEAGDFKDWFGGSHG